ncbi:26S protease regulatory subunit 6A [Trichinella murrelli]|uniref:26S protease regulatory subunit 6A n=1 Tax=Trichinella murrelli TaxID=144512 RepID=A0A0V0U7B8_9BILA|nr:26S protease regulatory subunit 6A [Trichinella murrelli]
MICIFVWILLFIYMRFLLQTKPHQPAEAEKRKKSPPPVVAGKLLKGRSVDRGVLMKRVSRAKRKVFRIKEFIGNALNDPNATYDVVNSYELQLSQISANGEKLQKSQGERREEEEEANNVVSKSAATVNSGQAAQEAAVDDRQSLPDVVLFGDAGSEEEEKEADNVVSESATTVNSGQAAQEAAVDDRQSLPDVVLFGDAGSEEEEKEADNVVSESATTVNSGQAAQEAAVDDRQSLPDVVLFDDAGSEKEEKEEANNVVSKSAATVNSGQAAQEAAVDDRQSLPDVVLFGDAGSEEEEKEADNVVAESATTVNSGQAAQEAAGVHEGQSLPKTALLSDTVDLSNEPALSEKSRGRPEKEKINMTSIEKVVSENSRLLPINPGDNVALSYSVVASPENNKEKMIKRLSKMFKKMSRDKNILIVTGASDVSSGSEKAKSGKRLSKPKELKWTNENYAVGGEAMTFSNVEERAKDLAVRKTKSESKISNFEESRNEVHEKACAKLAPVDVKFVKEKSPSLKADRKDAGRISCENKTFDVKPFSETSALGIASKDGRQNVKKEPLSQKNEESNEGDDNLESASITIENDYFSSGISNKDMEFYLLTLVRRMHGNKQAKGKTAGHSEELAKYRKALETDEVSSVSDNQKGALAEDDSSDNGEPSFKEVHPAGFEKISKEKKKAVFNKAKAKKKPAVRPVKLLLRTSKQRHKKKSSKKQRRALYYEVVLIMRPDQVEGLSPTVQNVEYEVDPEILLMSAEDINGRTKLLENEIRIMRSECARLTHEVNNYREKIKENKERIKVNRHLPYLVSNVVELLDLDASATDEQEGANIDEDAIKTKCTVIKTSTRATYFLPMIGLVDADTLKPGDLVGVNKDSYLILEKLPPEYDSRVKAMEIDERPTEKYSDIGGLDTQIQELIEAIVLPMTHKERFITLGIQPSKGVLLYGPPGTGKTMMARAVAAQTKSTFLKLAGPQLVQMFIGDGAKLVRDAFALAKEKAPAIIFIDELDAIGTKRFDSEKAGDREVQRTMLELLNQLDGFQPQADIKVIAATNRVDILDPALLRSGRLDRKIELPLPNDLARSRIMQIHSRKMNIDKSVNYDELARCTDDFNGAQCKAVVVEAGMIALRNNAVQVKHEDFMEAILEVQSKKKTALEYYA